MVKKKSKLPPGYIIEVTHKNYYMFDYPPNGQSSEDIIEQWFWQYSLNSNHAGRDGHKLSNINPVLEVKVVTEQEMIEEADKGLERKLIHYRKFDDLLIERPSAENIIKTLKGQLDSFGGFIEYKGEIYVTNRKYDGYLNDINYYELMMNDNDDWTSVFR